MHILIAPNAFKNSLDAIRVAEAIALGLQQSKLDCTTECFPIADGGDGTCSLIVKRCNDVRINQEVHDPLGRLITSSFGLIDNGKTAVIEMADASGLRLLKREELDPMQTNSYGTGELIKAALDNGVNRIIIAMGGSATVDGGCGILNALGIKFLDDAGMELAAKPAELMRLVKVNASALDPRILNCEVVILCDVNNKLLGPEGAAAVFGPQKGASAGDVKLLERFLGNFAEVCTKQTFKNMAEIKHGGVAGGATAGLHTWINAKLVNGIEYFLSHTGFDKALNKADLVITGEGSLDSQTLQGKGPYGVAVKAKAKRIPVIGLAGKVESSKEMENYFDELICINNEAVEIAVAMKNTAKNLVSAAKMIGNRMTSIK